MTPPENRPSPDLSALADRAIALRRSAVQTRLRLAAQRETLERLANGLQKARVVASVRKEAVAVSAPVPASLRAQTRRPLAWAALNAFIPFVVIGAAAYFAHTRTVRYIGRAETSAPAAFAPGRDGLARVVPPPPAADDDRGAEALLLVHEWKPAGVERTLLERLGGELDRPGHPPAWSVERTGPSEYLVRFRDGASEYAFETDVAARVVRPVADADSLFARR